ncbi:MAG: hypothetical protein COY38_01950 [Candidatus Aenigmarchaeota archaeon CG_4_10_14_0_8_um_filter_37_24]|nr:hypothetical protein [Candidatus Aenigmarchaeota archaeon]OIN85274.1 MAG: hypothetical protein AUJ50_05385 [Candidatus Aenigmarchaeota archaeon CG1_02_38_14]PIV69123.1 MAG: hypothetical protein COS07_01855 [Candidatus Aenigmarchaeota archaeon CG01_land_8_20_14_3_00_37_9]PIW41307.1 MAG: hypothetical protein COW21_02645 [Candidatus Aenigmarchaeota archaeon CG15_BIG_FIL_POST_REV_8_21_14_020_37_27]PIX51017.1 MAG: hypothetical protein COZ52_01115 [Candidatus Aenigmarchaeota archaeon CG_4_8_14_3_u
MIEQLNFIVIIGVLSVFLGAVAFLYFSERRRTKRIVKKLDKLDLKPIEDSIKKAIEEENKYLAKVFELEMFLENYRKATVIIGNKVDELEKKFDEVENLPKDYEMTYRDVVRKLLELDNKFTDKFKMVAEAVLKLNDEKRK